MWHQKAKGPPDGPPVFLIFVEKLNCPQSQAYQSISPVGTGLSLPDGALGVSLGTSIGNYSPLVAQQPVKLKIHRWRHRAGSSPATGTRLSLDAIRVPGSAFSFALPLAFVVCCEKKRGFRRIDPVGSPAFVCCDSFYQMCPSMGGKILLGVVYCVRESMARKGWKTGWNRKAHNRWKQRGCFFAPFV